MIQVYAPTTYETKKEIENIYSQLSKILKNTDNHGENIIMGNFNAKIGDEMIGSHGLGIRYKRGDCLIQFCRKELIIVIVTNIVYKLSSRRLSWKYSEDNIDKIVEN